jgi:hypothetical protein
VGNFCFLGTGNLLGAVFCGGVGGKGFQSGTLALDYLPELCAGSGCIGGGGPPQPGKNKGQRHCYCQYEK